MNTQHIPQPPSSHESAIPRNGALLALCALFSLLFGNPFAKLINELEALFAAWRNGTLPQAAPRAALKVQPQAAPAPAHRPRQAAARQHSVRILAARAAIPTHAPRAAHAAPARPHPAPRQQTARSPQKAGKIREFFSKTAQAAPPTRAHIVLYVYL